MTACDGGHAAEVAEADLVAIVVAEQQHRQVAVDAAQRRAGPAGVFLAATQAARGALDAFVEPLVHRLCDVAERHYVVHAQVTIGVGIVHRAIMAKLAHRHACRAEGKFIALVLEVDNVITVAIAVGYGSATALGRQLAKVLGFVSAILIHVALIVQMDVAVLQGRVGSIAHQAASLHGTRLAAVEVERELGIRERIEEVGGATRVATHQTADVTIGSRAFDPRHGHRRVDGGSIGQANQAARIPVAAAHRADDADRRLAVLHGGCTSIGLQVSHQAANVGLALGTDEAAHDEGAVEGAIHHPTEQAVIVVLVPSVALTDVIDVQVRDQVSLTVEAARERTINRRGIRAHRHPHKLIHIEIDGLRHRLAGKGGTRLPVQLVHLADEPGHVFLRIDGDITRAVGEARRLAALRVGPGPAEEQGLVVQVSIDRIGVRCVAVIIRVSLLSARVAVREEPIQVVVEVVVGPSVRSNGCILRVGST